ncbi:LOW QUALITY PROTEIN: hypothetical protein HID58_090558, partial [Brassica napus]
IRSLFAFQSKQKKRKDSIATDLPPFGPYFPHRRYLREDLLLLFILFVNRIMIHCFKSPGMRLLPRWSSAMSLGKRWFFQHRFCRLLSPGGDGFSSISIAGFVSPGRDGFSSISIGGFVSSGRDGFSSISIPAFSQSTTQSASVVLLLASLSKSQKTFLLHSVVCGV